MASRGVGTGGGKPPPPNFSENTKSALTSVAKCPLPPWKMLHFLWLELFVLQKTQKIPSLWWQSALCLREKWCSDWILYDCNYFSPPPPSVANISRKNVFRCPFHSKSAPRNHPPPPIFWCFLRPWWLDQYFSVGRFFVIIVT